MSSVQSDKISESRLRVWLHSWRVRLASQRFFTAYFFLSAMIIVVAFLIYAQIFVVRPMRQEANRMGKLYAFMHSVATLDKIEVKGFYVDVIFDTIQNPNFPVVITDEQGEPKYWKAIGLDDFEDHSPEMRAKVKDVALQLDLENDPWPFEFPGTEWGPDNKPVLGVPEIWQLHWGDSTLIKRLAWLPFVTPGTSTIHCCKPTWPFSPTSLRLQTKSPQHSGDICATPSIYSTSKPLSTTPTI